MSALLVNLILLVLYTYFGYFIAVIILGKIIRLKVYKNDIEPHVTMLIAAYNEEQGIAQKIEDTLKLEYAKEKFRIIVVSDGSTDGTDEIVKSYADKGVELLRVEGRVGKTEARNIAMASIQGEIIIFSDATTAYKEDLIQKMVRNFADPKVGMVTGHLIYRDSNNTQMGTGQKLYWKYESMIKKAQTSMGTLTGSVGCVTAFRKELYTPLPKNIIEDFTGPLMLVMKGFRVVYEEEALCFEETTQKAKNEWNMRVRVIRGGMTGMIHARKILNPISYPIPFFQLMSHKILRWLIPVFIITTFVLTNYMVWADPKNVFALVMLALQMIFYFTALCAYALEKKGIHNRFVAIPLYFLILNAASLVALVKTITSNLEATWETQREG
ncbi:MAG: glycosyltransferase family 2 protein [Bdellovibrionales bacterium]|nr:glycosyltransferase family 2 protein [Bdellovibrionales bacterium]